MKSNYIVLVVLMLTAFLFSCSAETQTVEPGSTSTAGTLTSFVSPLAPSESLSDLVAPPQVRTPQKGKGTVVGVLYDQTGNQFYAYRLIYLAETKEMQSNQEGAEKAYFAELDVSTSPFSQTDENGRFVIQDVEPGGYVLVARLPNLQEVLLYDVSSGTNISVQVQENKITDIGIVNILGQQ